VEGVFQIFIGISVSGFYQQIHRPVSVISE
jgi:hypothetical protein